MANKLKITHPKVMSVLLTILLACILGIIHYLTVSLLHLPVWWNWCYILIPIISCRMFILFVEDISKGKSFVDIAIMFLVCFLVFTSVSLLLFPLYAVIYFVKEGYDKWKTKDIRKAIKQENKEVEDRLKELGLKEDDYYLSFEKINGYGVLTCDDCGYKEEITAFTHGDMSCSIGRQCPNCHTIFTEYNESHQYHVFGEATEDCICPKCHTVVRKKEESILKRNDYPIVCPNCHRPHVQYHCRFMT